MYVQDWAQHFAKVKSQLSQNGFKPQSIDNAIEMNDTYGFVSNCKNDFLGCSRCKLHCNNKVVGQGCTDSPVMIVGEG